MAERKEIWSALRTGTEARRAGMFDEASERMSQALGMCGSDQDYERAHVLRELGELARNRHDPEAAQKHYEQAVALLRSSDDPLRLAHTIRHLGDVHTSRRQWPEAERCYVEALAIYRGHPTPDALDLANAIRAHAAMMTKAGRREEARPRWLEAGERYRELGVEAGAEECRRQAGCQNQA